MKEQGCNCGTGKYCRIHKQYGLAKHKFKSNEKSPKRDLFIHNRKMLKSSEE